MFGFNHDDPVNCITRSGMLACFLIVILMSTIFSKKNGNVKMLTFILVLGFLVSLFAYPIMWYSLGEKDPLQWLIVDFIMDAETRRVYIILSWALALVLSLPILQSSSKNFPRIVSRKLFHVLAVMMFLPVLYLDFNLLYFSLGIAASLMLLAECTRVLRVFRIHEILSRYMLSFTDERDMGTIVLSHFYLLVGCAITIWLVPRSVIKNVLPASAGILSVGVGDAVAAVVGTFFGKTKWFDTKKTVEGTAAAALLTSLLTMCLVSSEHYLSVTTFVTMTCLLETFTEQMDNLILPLYLFSLFSLLNE